MLLSEHLLQFTLLQYFPLSVPLINDFFFISNRRFIINSWSQNIFSNIVFLFYILPRTCVCMFSWKVKLGGRGRELWGLWGGDRESSRMIFLGVKGDDGGKGRRGRVGKEELLLSFRRRGFLITQLFQVFSFYRSRRINGVLAGTQYMFLRPGLQ